MSSASPGNFAPDPREPSVGLPEGELLLLPERSLQEWGIAVSLFAVSIVYLWPFRSYTTLNGDEGIVLQAAERILHGQVLYRDAFSFVTPGAFYFLALIFKIFGSSYLVARTVLVVYGGLFSVLTYLLARRVCSRWNAILAVYLQLVLCLPVNFILIHNWDSALWAVLTIYCAVWLLQAPSGVWAFGMGTCAAFTVLFEQSKGAGVVFGLVMGFVLIARYGPQRALWRRSYVLSLAAGFAWPLLVTLAYFGSQHGLAPMLTDWLWPLRHYSAVNKTPYGFVTLTGHAWETMFGDPGWGRRVSFALLTSPLAIISFLPVAALGFTIRQALQLRGRRETEQASKYYFLCSSAVVGMALAAIASGRPDFLHILFLGPPLFLVLGWISAGRGMGSGLLVKVQPLLVAFLLITFTGLGMALLWYPLNWRTRLETRRGQMHSSGQDSVLEYLLEHVPPGEKILVYPYQPMYYFLTATFSPTPYDYLQPGLHTPAQVEEVVSRLRSERPSVALFDLTFVGQIIPWAWPNTSAEALARDPVRDFLFASYRPCRVLASIDRRFVCMVRRDLPCPEASNAR